MRRLIGIAALGLLACGSSVTQKQPAHPAARHAGREVCPSSTSAATCTAMGESERDPEAAAALFTRACRAGDALGCARLAERYEHGRGVEHSVRKLDGSWLWNLSVGRVVERDAQGRAVRMVGTNRDITERKHAEMTQRVLESQLREAQKLQAIGTLAKTGP